MANSIDGRHWIWQPGIIVKNAHKYYSSMELMSICKRRLVHLANIIRYKFTSAHNERGFPLKGGEVPLHKAVQGILLKICKSMVDENKLIITTYFKIRFYLYFICLMALEGWKDSSRYCRRESI